jgi:hypothetical protein
MKNRIYLTLLAACLLTGCASSRSVLCVAPRGQFKPNSESELLSELNNQLPFTIPQTCFISKQKPSGLVGWAVVRNDKQKNTAKAKLKKASSLKLLQVEALTPEFKKAMKPMKK